MNTLDRTHKLAYYKAAGASAVVGIGGSFGRYNFPLHAVSAPLKKDTKTTAAIRRNRNRLSRSSDQHIPGGLTEGFNMSPEISTTGTSRQGL